jgi:hypothetical protein
VRATGNLILEGLRTEHLDPSVALIALRATILSSLRAPRYICELRKT